MYLTQESTECHHEGEDAVIGLDTCLAEAVDDVVNRQYGTEREGTVATGRLAQACDESVRARQQASGTQSDTLMLDVATISAWGDGRASRGNMRM